MRYTVRKISAFLIALILSNVFVVNSVYCYVHFYYPPNNNKKTDIVVTGDSYAGYFAIFESKKDLGIYLFANPGRTTEQNFEMLKDAVNFDSKCIVLSIGVNDHARNISPVDFERRLNELVSNARVFNKKLILHTYMNYDYVSSELVYGKAYYKIDDYDKILQRVAIENNNVYYIDMHDMNYIYFMQSDRLHYDRIFYDTLYERVKQLVGTI